LENTAARLAVTRTHDPRRRSRYFICVTDSVPRGMF
jgi:hypothetical protein